MLIRRQLSKIFGFKEGKAPSHHSKKLECEQHSSSEPFMRLKGAVFESRVTQESDGVSLNCMFFYCRIPKNTHKRRNIMFVCVIVRIRDC
jgi:hypothetical protein